jgi:hypothetical protein
MTTYIVEQWDESAARWVFREELASMFLAYHRASLLRTAGLVVRVA